MQFPQEEPRPILISENNVKDRWRRGKRAGGRMQISVYIEMFLFWIGTIKLIFFFSIMWKMSSVGL